MHRVATNTAHHPRSTIKVLTLLLKVVDLWCLDGWVIHTCMIKGKHELHVMTPDCTQSCPTSIDKLDTVMAITRRSTA